MNFSNSKSPITEEEVSRIEENLGFLLPPKYRSFVLDYNGGVPEKQHFHFYVRCFSDICFFCVEYFLSGDKLKETYRLATENEDEEEILDALSKAYPIGFLLGGTMILVGVLPNNKDKIYIYSGDFGFEEVANCIDDFLEMLVEYDSEA